MNTVVGQALDLIHNHLHQAVVPGQEVDVGDSEDRLLRDVAEGALGVGLDGKGRPRVEANEVVHLLEHLHHDGSRNRHFGLPDKPRACFHATEIPLAAHDVDLLGFVLQERPHILDCEGAMAVQNHFFPRAEIVIDLGKGGVLDVPVEIVLPWKLDVSQVAKVTRPSDYRPCEHELSIFVFVLLHRNGLDGVATTREISYLFHGDIEASVVVQVVSFGRAPEHPQELISGRPRLVGRIFELLWNRCSWNDVIHVVCAFFCLQLGKLVGHNHP
mmetsp:Transcript_85473/g.153871  ORF Transcript_85473/g.153871 Transcript_85473/m.153871 type:complete len:272 (+) Transcript_85473:656-1471(+)